MGHFLDGRTWGTVDELCQEWDRERRRHPFYICSLPDRLVDECWDSSADTYDGKGYTSIRGEIIDFMREQNMLSSDRTVLDIGCGPGLFSIPFSSCSSKVHCLDGSEKMIGRVKNSILSECIENITTQVQKWEEFRTDEKFNTIFTSLCPALNNPESILRMESLSNDLCVYVSSANHTGSIEVEVWDELGQDCSYRGYDTRFPCEFLKMMGRDPMLRFFSEPHHSVRDQKEVESGLIRRFEGYGLDAEAVRNSVEKVVSRHAEDGMISESRKMTLGFLAWQVPTQ